MEIRLEDLTCGHVHKAKDVCVYIADGTAIIVRRWRGLAPMMAADTPASLMPEDLFICAPPNTEDPVGLVRAALEYLGFRVDLVLEGGGALH